MFESMWSSMSNSMQLAQECLKQDNLNNINSAQPVEGIEKFAQIIESGIVIKTFFDFVFSLTKTLLQYYLELRYSFSI